MAAAFSSSSPLLRELLLVVAAAVLAAGGARGDLASDEAECSSQLVGLSTCLPYVQGAAPAPTPDCCSGLKQVVAKSAKCLCVLVKDRDNPQLGLKLNATLALSLPARCAAPANISQCPKLLNISPNSKDAQIFKQFGSSAPQGSVSSGSTGNSSDSNGSVGTHVSGAERRSYFGGGSGWLRVETFGGLLLLPIIMAVING